MVSDVSLKLIANVIPPYIPIKEKDVDKFNDTIARSMLIPAVIHMSGAFSSYREEVF